MSTLRTINRRPFEDLLGMGSGYVLDFTNASFESFIRESVGISIYADRYTTYGDSKAKRLRAVLDLEPDDVVGKLLDDLLEVWEYNNSSPDEQQKRQFQKCKEIVGKLIGKESHDNTDTEDQFLRHDYNNVSFKNVPIEPRLIPILETRFNEAVRCLDINASLSVIIMCGSILEGLLLGIALKNHRTFNQAKSTPRDATSGKPKQFQQWTLANLIDVSFELGFLRLDAKKFSHVLRDFRNYVHPFQQMSTQFEPDRHTAEICLQVLRAAIYGLLNRP